MFKKYNEHTEPLFKELYILDFGKSKLLVISKFVWQIKSNIILETISKLFKGKDRSYAEGDNRKFPVPNVKLEIVKISTFYQGPKRWNEIPPASKNKKSLMSFKNSYQAYLNLVGSIK